MDIAVATAAAEEDACLICLDTQKDVLPMTFKCGCRAHLHEACVGRWHAQRKDICPVCRACWHCERQLGSSAQRPQQEARQVLQPLEPLPSRMRSDELCASICMCSVILWCLILGILHATKIIQ